MSTEANPIQELDPIARRLTAMLRARYGDSSLSRLQQAMEDAPHEVLPFVSHVSIVATNYAPPAFRNVTCVQMGMVFAVMLDALGDGT